MIPPGSKTKHPTSFVVCCGLQMLRRGDHNATPPLASGAARGHMIAAGTSPLRSEGGINRACRRGPCQP
jgi:hypothetical protein